MPYRGGRIGEALREDRERIVLETLRSRARLVRAAVIVTSVLGGLAVGGLAYGWLRDHQFARMGGNVTAMIALLPTFGLALRAAAPLSRLVLSVLLPRWVTRLANAHGLDRADLASLAALLERS